MANITFEGYVQERNGKMLRVSEEYRKKDQAGNWGNDGYGDFTVWLRDEDSSPEVQAGAIVLVSGDLRVRKAEKDGRTFTNLNISFAKVGVTRLTNKYQGAAQQAQGAPNTGGTGNYATAPAASPQAGADAWNTPGAFSDDTPF